MRIKTRSILLAGALFVLIAVPGPAEELDVATYIELSIARLELIEESWRERDDGPSDEELEALYDAYGTDLEAYLGFGGEHRGAIESYLRKHEDLRDTIETLAAAIRKEISERSEE